MPTAQVNDLTINYDLADYTDPWRPSEVFLLYHGYSRNMSFWQNWVALLARDYRVMRFDARGCGETTKPSEGAAFSMEQLAGDAIGLMDQLGIERAHWVGESSGGLVGLQVALTHPERLSSLTLCNTPFQIPGKILSTYSAGEADQATAIEKYGVGGWCRKTLAYRLDLNHATPEIGDWYVNEMDKTPKHVAIALYRLFSGGSYWDQLPEVRVPTLILTGDQSVISQKNEMEQMHAQMPQAKLALLEGYGHGINLLAPERCVAEIRAFLAERR